MSQALPHAPLHSAPVSAQTSPSGDRPPLSALSQPGDARFPRPEPPLDNGRRTSEPSWAAASSPPQGRHGSDAGSRSLKMRSILNPSGSTDATSPSSRPEQARNGIQRPGEPSLTSQNGANTHNLPSMSELASQFPPGARPQEASDSARRAFPPGSISLPHPGMDSRKSPYTSTATTPQIGTPNGARATYPFPPQSATSTDRRGSDPIATAPQSQSNSPTTSYSSFGQTTKNSPATHYSQLATHGHHPPGYGMHPGSMNGHQLHMSEQPYRTGPPNAQGTYQLMTLDTGQGPIQVPVDIQAASKMADEKRKRNAGASARFRQRRKEKEREASQTISKLETQLRELGDQKDYYRVERDYFRTLVYQSGAQIHVTPRLPSPKPGQSPLPASHSNSSSGTEYQQNGDRGSDDGRNQRRRISTYSDGGAPHGAAQNSHYPPAQGPAGQYAQPSAYGYPRQDPRAQMATNGTQPPSQHPHTHYPPQSYDRAWKPPVQ